MADGRADAGGPFAAPYDVLAWGDFAGDRLEVWYEPTPRPTTAELEAVIAAEWERRTEAARRSGGLLFNGELMRYLGHDVEGAGACARLRMRVGPGCYRDFVGTNLFNHRRVEEFGWERFGNPVGTTATLTSADGQVVYGRRSRHVAYHAGHVHTFGGALEACDRGTDGVVDVSGGVMRELSEELGLRPEEVSALDCIGLVRDHEILQPELLFEARVGLTFVELVERWKSAEARAEHEGLVCLADEPAAVERFLDDCGLIAPVAVAALLLRGRRKWGEPWYAAAVASQMRRNRVPGGVAAAWTEAVDGHA